MFVINHTYLFLVYLGNNQTQQNSGILGCDLLLGRSVIMNLVLACSFKVSVDLEIILSSTCVMAIEVFFLGINSPSFPPLPLKKKRISYLVFFTP